MNKNQNLQGKCTNIIKGSVAKKIFMQFNTIIFTFVYHYLYNEND